MTEDNERHYKALFRDIARDLDPLPEPQDYLDLDAAGFLLIALGHLEKAKEKLDQEPPSRTRYYASVWTTSAANYIRRALKELDEQKEETCETS